MSSHKPSLTCPLLTGKSSRPPQIKQLRGGGEKVLFFFPFIFCLQLPAATRCQCHQTFGRWNYSEVLVGQKEFSRNHFVSCICSIAWHTAPRRTALTVFVKKKFNYIKVIEKLPVTNHTTKFLFLLKSSLCRAGSPSTEQGSETGSRQPLHSSPSPQVPGHDPSLHGWWERDNSAIDLTRSA